jgi:hypothetical protein
MAAAARRFASGPELRSWGRAVGLLERGQIPARLKPHAVALIPGGVIVALMLVWAVHDGGYDEDTWYWGALTVLALFAVILIARWGATRISRAAIIALGAFALYVAWSYLSITWAGSPGDALTGSNRALLYLLVFATMLVLPWTVRGALLALLVFAVGVGVVAIVLLWRLAAAANVPDLIIGGRLAAPTGYFNSTAALFTIGALVAIVLASRGELPAALRGLLIAFACAALQLGVIVQSRGWLFTLPLVAIVAILILPDRLRVAAVAVLPVAGAALPVHRLLAVYDNATGAGLNHAASRAGHAALLICAAEFVLATLLAWAESRVPARRLTVLQRRALGTIVTALAVAAVAVGSVAATHGHPVRFIERQWNGFSQPQTTSTGSHFTDVGSGRYDFWRVSLDAFLAHPIGGLGQDNFDDYYVRHRRTGQEPSYTHSLELRFLAHTGIVGFLLFATFMVAAITAVMPARRRRGLEAVIAGAALLPLIVWVIYGSIDWFWEIPALSGPALGFLGMAGALGSARAAGEVDGAGNDEVDGAGNGDVDAPAAADAPSTSPRPTPRPAWIRVLVAGAGVVALIAALYALVPAYLSVREVSIASDLRASDPARALQDLQTAADLNPLDADPGRIGGTIALQTGQYASARERFQQSISRDPGGWYAWLGSGLAASALGDRAAARHDLEMAKAIDSKDAVIQVALDRVDTAHPLTPADALQMVATSL